MKVRFFGHSTPINGRPSAWDYMQSFATSEEAAEAISDYVCSYDDPETSLAMYEVVDLSDNTPVTATKAN